MPEAVTTGAGAGTANGASGGGTSSTPASAATSTAAQTDMEFLSSPPPTETTGDAGKNANTEAASAKPAEATESEEINLAALEEGQPEWFAKVIDEGAKSEIQKLLDYQKAVSEKFKDQADLNAFFKDLPGGREQITALQTLSKEVAELDDALEANTPEGLATVAERYLSMTPDNGVGLLRAAAQHMAKANPEAWNSIASELINSSLKAAGIGADFNELLSGIQEMRDAVAKDDGEALGKSLSKLLGAPKQESKPDTSLTKAQERESAARNEAQKAQTESWQFRSEKSGAKIDNHISGEVGKLLSKVLPASIPEKDRGSLRAEIGKEVMSQLISDAWLASQVKQLIGWSFTGAKGPDYSNANLRADQGAFDKVTEIVINGATPKLIAKAVGKIVSQWSKDRAANSKAAIDRAKGAASKKDVGAGKTASTGNGRKPLTAQQLRNMSDVDFLNY